MIYNEMVLGKKMNASSFFNNSKNIPLTQPPKHVLRSKQQQQQLSFSNLTKPKKPVSPIVLDADNVDEEQQESLDQLQPVHVSTPSSRGSMSSSSSSHSSPGCISTPSSGHCSEEEEAGPFTLITCLITFFLLFSLSHLSSVMMLYLNLAEERKSPQGQAHSPSPIEMKKETQDSKETKIGLPKNISPAQERCSVSGGGHGDSGFQVEPFSANNDTRLPPHVDTGAAGNDTSVPGRVVQFQPEPHDPSMMSHSNPSVGKSRGLVADLKTFVFSTLTFCKFILRFAENGTPSPSLIFVRSFSPFWPISYLRSLT